MAELQKLLEPSSAFRSDLLQNFLSSASPLSSLSSPSSLTSARVDNSQAIDNSGNTGFYGNTQTTAASNVTSQTTTGSLSATDSCGNVQPLPGMAELLSRVESPLSDSQVLLVEQVTEAVVQSHLHTCSNTRTAVAQASARLGSDQPDPSTMWQQFTSNMAPEIAKAVGFCKSLPGFGVLEPEDQMNLIKQGSFEVMLARFCMLVDHVNEVMMDPGHKMKCPKRVVEAMPMGAFLSEFFPIAAHFNPLGVTDGELGLFTSILFICPDRDGLKSKETVEKIQSLLMQALYRLIKKNHAEPDNQFSKLLNTIPVFRAVNQKHSKALMAMKQKSPENYNTQFPSLHREVFP